MTTYEIDENLLARISVNSLLKKIKGNSKRFGIRMVDGIIKEGNTVKRRDR
ncbi:hypothetical protein [Lacrimispora xylanisolvens]|uniref:hypothetical protein n=1 Tax=Lacrimispora xylanisolvens TaxID=384636 RepID=UPI0024026D07